MFLSCLVISIECGFTLERVRDMTRTYTIPKQINFEGKLEEDYGRTMFFIAKKPQKTILNFSLDSLIVTDSIIMEYQKICDKKLEYFQ